MTAKNNQQLMQDYLSAWERGDLDALTGMLYDGCITHNLASGESVPNVEADACRIWHKGFTDNHLSIEKMVVTDDHVSVYWLLTGTHAGRFMEIAPTGKEVTTPGMEINRIVDGKIAEIWRLSDTLSIMQQLGTI